MAGDGLLAVALGGLIAVQVAAPLVAGRFIDQATAGAAAGELITLALWAAGLALATQGLQLAETTLAEHVGWSATNALRADLLAHLLRLEAAFHNAHTPSELIERTDGDVATLARFFSRFVVSVLGNGALILGVLGLLAALDWRVGLGLVGFVVLALAVMLRIYTDMLREPAEQIRNEVQDLQQANASIGRLGALLGTVPQLADGSGAALPPGPLAVELEGVSFGYGPEALALRDANLRVAAGRVLGVVGRTGSGKTTLARLLLRFYDPLAGAVRLGGVDLVLDNGSVCEYGPRDALANDPESHFAALLRVAAEEVAR
ncbi:MAG: hypothetical protein OHK0022_44990 [Roseiflexaceae bacterium]